LNVDETTIIAIVLGIIGIFGAGFASGRYLERSANAREQLKKQLDKLERVFEDQLRADPALVKWMQSNSAQIMDMISKMMKGDNKQ
jgi:uncharacterized membrane-anchored protein YhcB (DUF1043 family)